ncbi:unnamed protein product [Clavelina lepadiformis]|uniref:Uncharacterized protein n=1 Tax=Clavelina lepadiformis TaxID=159417 RepID=A0ABP0EWG1_CLALP
MKDITDIFVCGPQNLTKSIISTQECVSFQTHAQTFSDAGQGCAPYTSMAKTLESTPLGKTENCQERDKSLEDFDCVENYEDDDSDTEHSSQNRDNSGSSEGYTHPCFDECANC